MGVGEVIESYDFGLVLNDSTIRIRKILEQIALSSQSNFGNLLVVKKRTRTSSGALGTSYRVSYWVIVESIPVVFFGFTIWRINKEVLRTNYSVMDGSYMQLNIYSRAILPAVSEKIKDFSVHYPRLTIRVQKYFRPTVFREGSLIAEDQLL